MNGPAARAALKFIGCIGISLFWFGAVAFGSHGEPFKIFMYTVACGVCGVLFWPSQDEGEALLKEVRRD